MLVSEDGGHCTTASACEESELKSLNCMEKEHILKILGHTGGNYGETCKILGITRPTLRKKINDYGLKDYAEAQDTGKIPPG